MRIHFIHSSRSLHLSMLAAVIVITAPATGQVINEEHILTASDAAEEDRFGWTIAIDNNIVVVGSPQDDDNGVDSGSAYIYSAATGVENIKLLPNNGLVGDSFGGSVDISNGIVAVSAHLDDQNGPDSGAAYTFDAATGTQLAKLLPTDGVIFEHFATSIAIDQGIVAVGTPLDNDNGADSGSAYLFDALTGVQLAKLLPSGGSAGDQFGCSIDIQDGLVVVGARFDDDNGGSGSAYVFDASSGVQIVKLLPGDGSADDEFGNSVGIDNGIVAVGSRRDDDNGTNSGSAYIFDALTGVELLKIVPFDGVFNDQFGFSIAIDGNSVSVGADASNGTGSNSGSAYIFDISCPADTNHDGIVDAADFTFWLFAFRSGSPECDQNGDGLCTPADFTSWIANFNAGCF